MHDIFVYKRIILQLIKKNDYVLMKIRATPSFKHHISLTTPENILGKNLLACWKLVSAIMEIKP